MFRYLLLCLFLLPVLGHPSRKVRNVVKEHTKIWQRGIVAYVISGIFTNAEAHTIESAMREIENATSFHQNPCVTFVKRAGNHFDDPDYLYIKGGDSCSSDVGKQGGKQTLILKDECVTVPMVMRHLVRILGLYYEHDRPDRDSYIEVHLNNVANSDRSKFDKVTSVDTDLLGLLYDFSSITHFGPYDYAINKDHPTISSKVTGVSFGQVSKLSVKDVMKIQYLHNCGLDTSHIPKLPAHPIDCNFEQGLCNVADDWTNDIKWTRQSGPVSQSGPQSDHSNGNGYYLYAGGVSKTGFARLLGARELKSGIYCITLSYYLVGNSASSLSIYAEDFPVPKNSTLLLAKYEINPTNSWNQVQKMFDHTNPWRLTVQANITSPAGGVAIDDLHVYGGTCP